jgi:hypothetical protein
MQRIFLFTIILVFLVISLLTAQERPEVIAAYRSDQQGNNQYRKKGIMDGNLFRTIYYNQAEVGHWPDQPSGEWPRGSGHSYLDGVCVLVGAKVAVTVAGNDTFITPIEAAYREWYDFDPVSTEPWGWEPLPGYVAPASEIPALSNNPESWPVLWPSPVFTFLDVSSGLWVNNPEVNGEKGVDDDKDGYIDNFTYWYGYFGRGVTNADLETFFVMDDARDREWSRVPYQYYPIKSDSSRGGLGLRVEVRGFQWSHVLAEDNIFWHYDIVNISDTTYEETVFGFLTDVGIGGTDDSGDDNASFDTKLDIAYGWDESGTGTSDFGTWSPVGYFGYAYLESPGNPFNGIDDDEDGLRDERRDDGIDNDGDWSPYLDLNLSGEWDQGEPLNDDLGKDGVGPFDRQYNGPDEGEADGLPTPGEPDFDRTDKDESDQIGLTSMSIYRLIEGGGGDGWPKHDEGLWRRMSSYLVFDTTLQRSNIHMLFGSGTFRLEQNRRERFSMAFLCGADLQDLITNKITVQEIYNANYNFSKPPYKPTVTAVPGNGRVFLYWDEIAEESRDPLLPDSLGNPRKDFEGYLIYRSTEPDFNDIKLITNSHGEALYWKPIKQFDLADGIVGEDPIGINGAHFWRGSDTGLSHSYVDEDVTNGQRYYYAVVSYDQGDPEFGESGLQPTECTKIIREEFTGAITFVDINTAVVTPNAPAAGYVSPSVSGDLENITSGLGTGSLGILVLDPAQIEDDQTYRMEFASTGTFPFYETSVYSLYRVESDTMLPLLQAVDATLFGEEYPSQPVDGFIVTFENDTAITVDYSRSGWLIGSSNLDIQVLPHTRFVSRAAPWPADYKIKFFDTIVDTSFNFKIPVTFKVYNTTSGYEAAFELFDNDGSTDLSFGDVITIIEFIGTNYRFAYDIQYNRPVNPFEPPEPPVAGDEYVIETLRPFTNGDYFEFTTVAAQTNTVLAKDQLDDIKVVPNPYIMGASWEPRRVFGAGRGTRKIDFIHLPAKCTIRIFTISGSLVKTIEHNNEVLDGSQSWNLVSDDGMDIAYGVYIYHVDAPNIGKKIGKFAVVK